MTKKTKQAAAEQPVEKPARDARLKLKIRTPDGASHELNGMFPNATTFAIYMLACDWGDGETHKVTAKVDKEYEAAAKAFLDASEAFYNRAASAKKAS